MGILPQLTNDKRVLAAAVTLDLYSIFNFLPVFYFGELAQTFFFRVRFADVSKVTKFPKMMLRREIHKENLAFFL